MKLFVDECVSPQVAHHLNVSGLHEAIHPRDYGRCGETDPQILARCLKEDRVIVTVNAIDFKKLIATEEIHPGLIALPSVSRDRSIALLDAAIKHLTTLGDPRDVIVNHVLEIDEAGRINLQPLPSSFPK